MAAKARPPKGSDWLDVTPSAAPAPVLSGGAVSWWAALRRCSPWPGPDWTALQRLLRAPSTASGTPSFPYKEITRTKAFVCGADFTEGVETKGVYRAEYKKLKVESDIHELRDTVFSRWAPAFREGACPPHPPCLTKQHKNQILDSFLFRVAWPSLYFLNEEHLLPCF